MASAISGDLVESLSVLVRNSTELTEREKNYYDVYAQRRFLFNFKTPKDSYQAIVKNAKWRKEFGVENLNPNTDPNIKRSLELYKVKFLSDTDTAGRPVVYMNLAEYKSNEINLDEFTRFVVYVSETASNMCKDQVNSSICVLIDLKSFGYTSVDRQTIAIMKMLQWLAFEEYPERLGSVLLINYSTLFKKFWIFLKPWIPKLTRTKIFFIHDEKIRPHINPDIIPRV